MNAFDNAYYTKKQFPESMLGALMKKLNQKKVFVNNAEGTSRGKILFVHGAENFIVLTVPRTQAVRCASKLSAANAEIYMLSNVA